MKTVALVLLLATFSHAQDTPFWTRQQIIAQSANFALRAADTALTCRDLSRGWIEAWEPTQTCRGVVLWTMAGVPASIGLSYALHRTHHDRIARWVPYIFASGSAAGITYSFWPRRQHSCAANSPCE